MKALEAETNHDVKALEYFLKEKIGALGRGLPLEMIHFACTSEDINNLAYALILREFVERALAPTLDRIAGTIGEIARRYKDVAMIARTHGQEASPTTVGKEFAIFAWRLDRQIGQLRRQEYLGKANGAVGNFNAHQFAYPEADWLEHSRNFVEGLGLDVESADDADRESRFSRRDFPHDRAHRDDPDRLRARHLGLHFDRLFHAKDRRGRGRLVGNAA